MAPDDPALRRAFHALARQFHPDRALVTAGQAAAAARRAAGPASSARAATCSGRGGGAGPNGGVVANVAHNLDDAAAPSTAPCVDDESAAVAAARKDASLEASEAFAAAVAAHELLTDDGAAAAAAQRNPKHALLFLLTAGPEADRGGVTGGGSVGGGQGADGAAEQVSAARAHCGAIAEDGSGGGGGGGGDGNADGGGVGGSDGDNVAFFEAQLVAAVAEFGSAGLPLGLLPKKYAQVWGRPLPLPADLGLRPGLSLLQVQAPVDLSQARRRLKVTVNLSYSNTTDIQQRRWATNHRALSTLRFPLCGLLAVDNRCCSPRAAGRRCASCGPPKEAVVPSGSYRGAPARSAVTKKTAVNTAATPAANRGAERKAERAADQGAGRPSKTQTRGPQPRRPWRRAPAAAASSRCTPPQTWPCPWQRRCSPPQHSPTAMALSPTSRPAPSHAP